MLDGGQSRIVALQMVEGAKPEQLVAADLAAQPEAPGDLMIGRRVVDRGEDRGSDVCSRRGFFDPLREGVLRAPGVLVVVEKALAVQAVGAVAGLKVHATPGGMGGFGFDVAGNGLHFTDRRLARAAAAGPGLFHFGPAGCAAAAEGQRPGGSIDGDGRGLGVGAAQGGGRIAAGLGGGGRRIQCEVLPVAPTQR